MQSIILRSFVNRSINITMITFVKLLFSSIWRVFRIRWVSLQAAYCPYCPKGIRVGFIDGLKKRLPLTYIIKGNDDGMRAFFACQGVILTGGVLVLKQLYVTFCNTERGYHTKSIISSSRSCRSFTNVKLRSYVSSQPRFRVGFKLESYTLLLK